MVGLFVASGQAVAAGAPPSPSLLISEVYAPESTAASANGQWFELFNPTQYTYSLRGLQLGNSKVIVPINSDVVLNPGNSAAPTPDSFAVVVASRAAFVAANPNFASVKIVEAPELFPLDTAADALALYTPISRIVIDQVNWGKVDKTWPNYNGQMGASSLRRLTGNDSGKSWGRTPANRDSNDAADWTLHSTLSPGSNVDPIAPQTAFQGGVTNIVGVLGSFLLWVAFIVIGLLAYHFERTRDTRTYWQLLLLAPSGLLFYTIVNVLAFMNSGQLSDQEKWIAFPVLAVSAVLCLVGMYLFRNKAIVLLEGR